MTPNALMIHICREIHTRGLVSAYGGNVSLKMKKKIIITPKGSSMAEIKEDDLVVIDFDGRILFGSQEPSSETLLHINIYKKRPDVSAIIHTHPAAATAFAYVGKTIKAVSPDTHQMSDEVPIVPFFPVGSSELAEAVGHVVVNNDALLLEKHGVIAVGKDLYDAFYLTEMIEDSAKMNLYIKMLI